MSPATSQSDYAAARVNQAYRTYLRSVFKVDYYREKHAVLVSRSKHMDFLIALGAAVSGGSGLGILASPSFAWICAPLTTFSTIGAIAKGNYDWQGRLQKYLEFIEFFKPISLQLEGLVDDIQAQRAWTNEMEAKYEKIRAELTKEPADTSRDLSIEDRRRIQDAVRRRTSCASWWNWEATA